MDPASTIAIIGILATCVGSLIWIIKHLFEKMLPAVDSLVEVTQANTSATKSADEYLRQRNGRDIEFHEEILNALKNIITVAESRAEKTSKELKRVGDLMAERVMQEKGSKQHQTVIEQTVEHQTVKGDVQSK